MQRGQGALPGMNREGDREKMRAKLVGETTDSWSKSLEMGKSKGGWEWASNSNVQEPGERARLLNSFPEPQGAAAFPCTHTAPHSPQLPRPQSD